MNRAGFLDVSRHEFRRLRSLADGALTQLDESEWFANPGPESNSVAVIVKHLAGNMRSRWRDFLVSDGEKPDRDRDAEFVTEGDSRAGLIAAWNAGWVELFAAVDALDESDLERKVTLRGEPHAVMQAIARQLTHYAYHIGQLVFLAKTLTGPRWQALSVPRGASRAFNARPEGYLAPKDKDPNAGDSAPPTGGMI
jgi:hypothetical protein